MGQEAPYRLPKLPPKREKVETSEILRNANKAALAIAELKGIAQTINPWCTSLTLKNAAPMKYPASCWIAQI